MWGSSQVLASVNCDSTNQLCTVSVLIEQNSVEDDDYPELLARVPGLQQLHLRVSPPGPLLGQGGFPATGIAAATVATIEKIRSVNQTVKIGFHPDLSVSGISSYTNWGCKNQDNDCLFSHSINLMNAINLMLDADMQISIYSLEQSYPIPTDASSVAKQKQCLQGIRSSTCPIPSVVPVQYGYVAPSCMDDGLFGPGGYDYGYPQMYGTFGPNNISKDHPQYNWIFSSESSYQTIPASSYPGGAWPSVNQGFVLVDSLQIISGNPPPFSPEQVIPVDLTSFTDGDIHSIYELYQATPQAAGQTLAGMVAFKYGNQGKAPGFPCGPIGTSNPRFFTLTGEPEFLGSPGWTIPKLNTFYESFSASFGQFGVNSSAVNSMVHAIWGFDTMTGPGNLLGTDPATPLLKGPRSSRLRFDLSTGPGHGVVTSDPAGIHCGRRCSHEFPIGTSVRLVATADPGYRFSHWSGACRGVTTSCVLKLQPANRVAARFVPKKQNRKDAGGIPH